MDTTHIEKYANVMKEIKLRMEVINRFLSGQKEAVYVPTTVETVGLQFRKIFELIAMASLAANKEQYAAAYTDFAKHWEAAKLLKNLQRTNSNFYPSPVIEVPSNDPRVMHELKERDQDYLTQSDLIEAHGRCGALMHAENPFGNSIDYEFYQKSFPVWRQKIINLLDNHKVHLVNDDGFWLFHMLGRGQGQRGLLVQIRAAKIGVASGLLSC